MGYKKICELGVSRGKFLSILALSDPDHLVGIDVWDKYDKEAYSHNPHYYHKLFPNHKNKAWREKIQKWSKGLSFKVDIIVDFTVSAAKMFEDEYFDFVYVDANHTYDGVTADLEAWYPKVRKGGMIAGHDYFNKITDSYEMRVKEAVEDFANKIDKFDDISTTHEPYVKSFFIIK
jgi:hypothetical protein